MKGLERPTGGTHTVETHTGAHDAKGPDLREAHSSQLRKPAEFESRFEPGTQRATTNKQPEVSQGMLSRFFSWLFGSKAEKVKTQEASRPTTEALTKSEPQRPSMATTNMLNTLDKLAQHLAQNPLSSRGEQRLSFEGLTAGERARHLDQIQKKGDFYLNDLKKLSPNDQFQLVLLLARELKKSTGTPLSSMAEPAPWAGDLSSEPPQLREALGKIRNLGPQTGPKQVQDSVMQMAASLAKSGAATPEQLAGLLHPALTDADPRQLGKFRDAIEGRASQLTDSPRAAPSPMDSRNATVLRAVALAREADSQMQDMRSSIGTIVGGPGNPDAKILGADSRLANMLQKFIDAQAGGAISKDDVKSKFEQAFKVYNDLANALGKENPDVRSARPEKMLALLDKVPD